MFSFPGKLSIPAYRQSCFCYMFRAAKEALSELWDTPLVEGNGQRVALIVGMKRRFTANNLDANQRADTFF